MVNSVSVQTIELLHSALLGISLGVLFDVIRLIRMHMPRSRVITAVFDTLFWFIACVSLFAFVLTYSGGKMRWYVIVGVFSGGFVYMSAFSEILLKIMVSLIAAIRKILNLITRPLYLVLRWVWQAFKKSGKGVEHVVRNVLKGKREKKRKADSDGNKKRKKAQQPAS